MARYVDAEKIELAWYVPDAGYLTDWQKEHNAKADFAQKILDGAQSEDVAPVKVAKWHTYDTAIDSYQTRLECSYCQYDFTFENLELDTIKYCPHCGAKMDGAGE